MFYISYLVEIKITKTMKIKKINNLLGGEIMGSGTDYYRITHTGGSVVILAFSEVDAIDKFKKQYPQYSIKSVEKK